MTFDDLKRIESAYHSGLQVQIWSNGVWYNYDDRESHGFSEHRQYRIVGNEYAKIAEEKIKNLEKEIAELKRENAEYESEAREVNFRADKYIKRTVPKLVKAREIIQKLLEEEKENMYWEMNGSDKSSYFKIKKEAEEFIEHVFENEED